MLPEDFLPFWTGPWPRASWRSSSRRSSSWRSPSPQRRSSSRRIFLLDEFSPGEIFSWRSSSWRSSSWRSALPGGAPPGGAPFHGGAPGGRPWAMDLRHGPRRAIVQGSACHANRDARDLSGASALDVADRFAGHGDLWLDTSACPCELSPDFTGRSVSPDSRTHRTDHRI